MLMVDIDSTAAGVSTQLSPTYQTQWPQEARSHAEVSGPTGPTSLPQSTSLPHFSRVTSYQLPRFPTPKKESRDKFKLTAISPTGHKVALVSKTQFWILCTTSTGVSGLCTGNFSGNEFFRYGQEDLQLQLQHPVLKTNVFDVLAISLSDRYLAIAARGHLMAFILEGNSKGRWVISNPMEQ